MISKGASSFVELKDVHGHQWDERSEMLRVDRMDKVTRPAQELGDGKPPDEESALGQDKTARVSDGILHHLFLSSQRDILGRRG